MDFSKIAPERQMDFWLGKWKVTDGGGQTGTNHVVQILDQKIIQENFEFAGPFKGMSVSVYHPRFKTWMQTWVDSSGSYWAFTGGPVEDRFIIYCDDLKEGVPVKLRMIFYNIAADQLDWSWEASQDGGETWEQKWHLHYERISDS